MKRTLAVVAAFAVITAACATNGEPVPTTVAVQQPSTTAAPADVDSTVGSGTTPDSSSAPVATTPAELPDAIECEEAQDEFAVFCEAADVTLHVKRVGEPASQASVTVTPTRIGRHLWVAMLTIGGTDAGEFAAGQIYEYWLEAPAWPAANSRTGIPPLMHTSMTRQASSANRRGGTTKQQERLANGRSRHCASPPAISCNSRIPSSAWAGST